MIYFTACFTATMMTLAYSDSFITDLTIRKFGLPFVDFKGAIEDGTYQVDTIRVPVNTNHFQVQQSKG
jgi:hypothetical protein